MLNAKLCSSGSSSTRAGSVNLKLLWARHPESSSERASGERVGRDERGSTLDGPTTRRRRRSTARGFPHLSIIGRDEGNHLFEGAAVRRRGAQSSRGCVWVCHSRIASDPLIRTTKKLFVIPSLAAQAVEKGHKAINVNWTDGCLNPPPSKTLSHGARFI